MSSSTLPMPCFDAPPVVETVMGVHFQPLPAFHVAARSLFWSTLRDEFPDVEEKPPVAEVREEFGENLPTPQSGIRWQIGTDFPSPRLWAKSTDRRHTIQIQTDALMVNWERAAPEATAYLPYKERRQDFADKLERLRAFLTDHELGDLIPTTCFVTYINHVEYAAATEFAPLLERMLTVWKNETGDGWLPSVEQASLKLAYAMPEQRGRLHVNVVPAIRHRDQARMLRVDLTARGVPHEQSISSALAWIDEGHEWIVRGFASLTRPEMHQQWKRTR